MAFDAVVLGAVALDTEALDAEALDAVALVDADFFAGAGLATTAFLVGADFLAGTDLATTAFLGAEDLLVAAAAVASAACPCPLWAGVVLPASAALIADTAFFTAMFGPFTVAFVIVPTDADRWREDKAILRRTQWRNAAQVSVSPRTTTQSRAPWGQHHAQRGADRHGRHPA